MAVTSIWPIKNGVRDVIVYACNPEKTAEGNRTALHSVANVIEYAADELKTERCEYVTGINCRQDNAISVFNETRKRWGKEKDKRVCYHAYHSFKSDEVDADTAHKIGVELAKAESKAYNLSEKLKPKRTLFEQAEIYFEYKPLYETYLSKWALLRKNFYEKHSTELKRFENAKSYLKSHCNIEKLSLKQLDKELLSLAHESRIASERAAKLKEINDMIKTIQITVKSILQSQENEKRKAQEKPEISKSRRRKRDDFER